MAYATIAVKITSHPPASEVHSALVTAYRHAKISQENSYGEQVVREVKAITNVGARSGELDLEKSC